MHVFFLFKGLTKQELEDKEFDEGLFEARPDP
jgi:hypothetical protein